MITSLQGRRIGILGMGRSGIGAARLIQRLGGTALISDQKPLEQLSGAAASLAALGITVETGSHRRLLDDPWDMIVVSPGAVISEAWLHSWRARGTEVCSEIEFAARCFSGAWIGVTGSNGKTTTVTLIETILREAGRDARAAGNIGAAWSDCLPAPAQQLFVIEVSSFQLEHAPTLAPRVAVLLNVLENHLDRHGDLETYGRTKLNLFRNLPADGVAILNADDAFTRAHLTEIPGRKVFCGESADADWRVSQDTLAHRDSQILRAAEWRLKGRHNLLNAAAAAAACFEMGVEGDAIRRGLIGAHPVPHRIEFVRHLDGVDYINDSKSTNLAATLTALQAVTKPVILLLGGRAKRESFAPLAGLLGRDVKALIAYGEAREKIQTECGPHAELLTADRIPDALERARTCSAPGDTILLSPGCASFDHYRNFEERGEHFISLVHSL